MLSNPLPIEIKIVNLVLMHRGTIAFEAFPTTFSIQSGKEPISVNLLGVPKEEGELTITGYECTVLGIPCKVHLQTLSSSFPSEGFTVQVVKPLPQMQVSLTRVNSQEPSITENLEGMVLTEHASSRDGKIHEVELDQGGSTHILYGEEAWFELTLTNISNLQVSIRFFDRTHSLPLSTTPSVIQLNFFLISKYLFRHIVLV